MSLHAHAPARCIPSCCPPLARANRPPAWPTVTHPTLTADLRTVGRSTVSTQPRLRYPFHAPSRPPNRPPNRPPQGNQPSAVDRQQSTVSALGVGVLRPALCCPPRAPDRPPRRSTVSAPRAAHPRVPPQRPSVTACPVTCVNCQRQSCSNESPAVRERCCLPRAPRTPFLPASAAPRQCSGLRSDRRRNRRCHGRRGGWQCANRLSTSDAHKRRRHCG